MQRVALVSTSGPGHFNTIHSLYQKLCGMYKTQLYVVRYADDKHVDIPDVCDLKICEYRPSNVAKVFNRKRADTLFNPLLMVFKEFNPDIIIYDFFCLEALKVALELGIPSICSIPATLNADATETCSDALLPRDHIYYIWDHPRQLSISPVKFMGPRFLNDSTDTIRIKSPSIYITFGTVIPKYSEYTPKLIKLLRDIIDACLEMYPTHTVVVFGLEEFCHINEMVVWMHNDRDLYAHMLKYTPDLLIFHGGGNTFTECRACNVRPLVFPFFGDQYETSRLANPTIDINTISVAEAIVKAMQQEITPIYPPFIPHTPFSEDFSDFFKPGDLVFGQKLHRRTLQSNFPQIDLHLEKYCSFTELSGEYPAIADVYNDEPSIPDADTPYGTRYHLFDSMKSKLCLSHISIEEHKLVHYCILLLQLTICNWRGIVHFVIPEDLDELGPATRKELRHVLGDWARYKHGIIFYNQNGKRVKKPNKTI